MNATSEPPFVRLAVVRMRFKLCSIRMCAAKNISMFTHSHPAKTCSNSVATEQRFRCCSNVVTAEFEHVLLAMGCTKEYQSLHLLSPVNTKCRREEKTNTFHCLKVTYYVHFRPMECLRFFFEEVHPGLQHRARFFCTK